MPREGTLAIAKETANQLEDAAKRLAAAAIRSSVVVIANRYGVRDLLTLDERHFRVLRGPGGRPFRLLPADA